jgi:hypothetical protein
MLVDSNKVIDAVPFSSGTQLSVFSLYISLITQNFFLSLLELHHPLDPHPLTAVANLCSSYGMSSCFISLHPYQVRLQYLHRKHPSSCNGGPPLSITYLQMTFCHSYCVTSPAGIVHRCLLSLLLLHFQD